MRARRGLIEAKPDSKESPRRKPISAPGTSKTKQAIALVDGGLTPYAAAKQMGIAPVTVYRALEARQERQDRPVCPTCHRPLKSQPDAK